MEYIEENWEEIIEFEKNTLDKIVSDLKKCDGIDHNSQNIDFLTQQLSLLGVSETRRRYSPSMLLNAFSIYIKSPKAYEECRKLLILPSIRHMRRLSSFLKPDPYSKNENMNYLKSQIELLND